MTAHDADHAVEVAMVKTGRGPVELARTGQGPPVILVHGIPGSWRQAIPLAADLAERYTVLLPSRPGYGRTPLSSGRTASDHAALYIALLDALALGGAAVIGISGGGPSALAFAQEHPERTTSLGLLCALAPHLMKVPRAMRIAAALPPLAVAGSVIGRRRDRRLLDDPRRRDARLGADLTPDERDRASRDPRIVDDLVGFVRSHLDAPAGLAGLRNDTRQVLAAGRRPPFATDGIAAPTLVMHGDADGVVPLTHAEHHTNAIRGARLVVVRDAGHVFLITRRAETSAIIQDHLATSTS